MDTQTTHQQGATRKTAGRPSLEAQAAELQRMRAGIRAYVTDELAKGHEVCSILTNYVESLGTADTKA